MQIKFATTASIGLLAMILSACGTAQTKTAEAMPATPAQTAASGAPALTAEAQQALAAAAADWKTAKANFALWTTTDKLFKDAEASAKAGDSAAVIKQAGLVSAEVKVAMEQKNYPSTEMK
jgi:hypothetical protein